MAQRTIDGVAGLEALVGESLGTSDWLEVTQDQVNRFADATLDYQWIHVDPERARAESPFGGPIAHGYLTLALLPHFLGQVVEVTGISVAINYGLNRLRFPAPVPIGSRVRLGVVMKSCSHIPKGVQTVLDCRVEIDGAPKPALIAEVVFWFFP
jgi:acyl dehydratase